MSSFYSLKCKNLRVFIRADLNIPISEEENFINDHKLAALKPTIDYLLTKQASCIIIGTHLGRPTIPLNKKYQSEPKLSTIKLIPLLKAYGYTVIFEEDLEKAKNMSLTAPYKGTIILLENLRFFAGEQQKDIEYLHKLKNLADIYINDAFGLIHRLDNSITQLPILFPPEKRAYGLLINNEEKNLDALMHQPKKPFTLLLGGSKPIDKIPLINNFLGTSNTTSLASTILTGGILAQAFLAAQGNNVAAINLSTEVIKTAKTILKQALNNNINILVPIDLLVQEKKTGILNCITPNKLNESMNIIDIGNTTINLYIKILSESKTVFVNGTMGIYEQSKSSNGTKSTLAILNKNIQTVIIGGGDAVAATYLFNLQEQISFLSTGGGATLAYLGKKNPKKELLALNIL